MIDAEIWLCAEEETKRHREQIQGFLYRDGDDWKSGLHVIRDCLKKAGNQVLWSKEGTAENYEEISAEAQRMIRFFEIELISKRYEELKGQWSRCF